MGLFHRRPSFESSVRPELPVLYRVARRMERQEADAEDLVQKCLVRAFAGWKSFDGGHLRSWLIKIMRNEALAERRGLEASLEFVELEETDGQIGAFWDEVLWRSQADGILEMLRGLPEDFRLAVQLCDVEQLSYVQASEALEIPMGTLKSRLHRAREMLRCRLEGGSLEAEEGKE